MLVANAGIYVGESDGKESNAEFVVVRGHEDQDIGKNYLIKDYFG